MSMSSSTIHADRDGQYALAKRALGDEFGVNPRAGEDNREPDVAALGSGYSVCVWSKRGASDTYFRIVAQILDHAGVRKGPEISVHTDPGNALFSPRVAPLSKGGFAVVWRRYSGQTDGVFAQWFNASWVKQGGVLSVNADVVTLETKPKVAGFTTGGFVVAWHGKGPSNSPSFSRPLGQWYDSSGNPVGGNLRVDIGSLASPFRYGPAVTALANGEVAFSWIIFDGRTFGLRGRRFNAMRVDLGEAFRADLVGFCSSECTALTMTDLFNGEVWTTWQADPSAGGDHLYAKRWTALGQTGDEIFRVAPTPAGIRRPKNSAHPATTASLMDGRLFISWDEENSDRTWDIHYQILNRTGHPVTAIAPLNLHSTSNQLNPTAARLSNGDVIAVWDGVGATDVNGVWGRIFDLYTPSTTVALTTTAQQTTTTQPGTSFAETTPLAQSTTALASSRWTTDPVSTQAVTTVELQMPSNPGLVPGISAAAAVLTCGIVGILIFVWVRYRSQPSPSEEDPQPPPAPTYGPLELRPAQEPSSLPVSTGPSAHGATGGHYGTLTLQPPATDTSSTGYANSPFTDIREASPHYGTLQIKSDADEGAARNRSHSRRHNRRINAPVGGD